jgi:60 kDa SS-A/Ro ribonucleoprotein
MAKLNKKSTVQKNINKEGGESFVMKDEQKLTSMVATCLFNEPKFYGDTSDDIIQLAKQVAKKNPKFILQLAHYARTELYLRTISTVLLTIGANINECKPFVKEYTYKIIQRADEINEIMACQLQMYGKPIPNSLKKGIVKAFTKFEEYHFSKYNRNTSVKFKDVIMLTHPKQPSELIKKILDNTLTTPETWETVISTKGSTLENWRSILPKMGYMAVLRNINNFLKVGMETKEFLPILTDYKKVLKSKQFPFRFYSAIKAIDSTDPFVRKEIIAGLSQALEYAIENIPKLKGRTFIATDTSGSMGSMNISNRSTICPLEIGALMTAMAIKFSDNAIASVFGTNLGILSLTGNVLDDAHNIAKVNVGWSTNGYKVVEYLNSENISVDRVLIFTDEELYNGSLQQQWIKYTTTINPNAKLYVFNLNSYGNSCVNMNTKNVYKINGWSDKIFKFIESEENDNQIEYIKSNY